MITTIIAYIFLSLSSVVISPIHNSDSTSVSSPQSEADRIIDEAKKYLGLPYHYGSTGPKSFDCSGFTSFIFKKFGYSIGRSSRDQAHDGVAVKKGFKNLRKGDIVVFGSRRDKNYVGHVGILIEADPKNKDFTFIHADHSGVVITRLKSPYYSSRYLGARRILPDSDSTTVKEDPSDSLYLKFQTDSLQAEMLKAALDSLISE